MLKAVAEKINQLVLSARATVTETHKTVTVNGLAGVDARELFQFLRDNELKNVSAVDDGGECDFSQLTDQLSGVTLVADKPDVPDNVQAILSQKAFKDALERPIEKNIVWYSGIDEAFETELVRYAPWWDLEDFEPQNNSIDPRRLVKVLANVNLVDNMGRWLLRSPQLSVNEDWKSIATIKISMSMAQEIEADGSLLFKGPPVSRFDQALLQLVPDNQFSSLQSAAQWVYSNEREAETRHGLFASEVARCAPVDTTLAGLLSVMKRALEGSKIAYSFGLNKQGQDALKALSDLKKSASDEAAKLNDTTKGLASAVTAAVVGNLGIIVARLSLPATNQVITYIAPIIALVLFVYVLSIIYTGYKYIEIQQDLRSKWKDKLYKYLNESEYNELVVGPASASESLFKVASYVAFFMALVLFAAVALYSYCSSPVPSASSAAIETKVKPSHRRTQSDVPNYFIRMDVAE